MTPEIENAHETGATRPFVLEDQLEDLKRLLEENSHCPVNSQSTLDVERTDQCAELTESIAMLQRDIAALKGDPRERRQNTAMAEQKDLLRILKESHEDRIRQITAFQQDMKALSELSHAEMLSALSRGNQ